MKKPRHVPEPTGSMLEQGQAYVDKTTAHWHDQVAAWEVNNEPSINYLSPKGYVANLKDTTPIIRKKVPNAAIVGLGGSFIGADWMKAAIKLGATNYCVTVSFRVYPNRQINYVS